MTDAASELDVETPLPCLLRLAPPDDVALFSDNDFLQNAEVTEVISNLLGRNPDVEPVVSRLPANLSILTSATYAEIRRNPVRPISRIGYGQSAYIISEAFRSALSDLDIGRQEFSSIKIYSPLKSYISHLPFGEAARIFVGEYYFWRPLDVIDIIDFDRFDEVAWREQDIGGFYTKAIDPTWPAGSFAIEPTKTVPIRTIAIDVPVFAVRGLDGRFVSESFYNIIKDMGLDPSSILRPYHLDPKRDLELGKAAVRGRISRLPEIEFVGTRLRAPARFVAPDLGDPIYRV